jgi:hypothetical protein
MTERYAHLSPANVAAAVRVLDGAVRSQQPNWARMRAGIRLQVPDQDGNFGRSERI